MKIFEVVPQYKQSATQPDNYWLKDVTASRLTVGPFKSKQFAQATANMLEVMFKLDGGDHE